MGIPAEKWNEFYEAMKPYVKGFLRDALTHKEYKDIFEEKYREFINKYS